MVPMRVISANVNGIRAAVRRGGLSWLAAAEPDVLCLQEVRASDAELTAALADTRSPLARRPRALRYGGPGGRRGPVPQPAPAGPLRLEDEPAVAAGRWVEAELDLAAGPVTVVRSTSTPVRPDPRQDVKNGFLAA